jgi:predicted nucleotidyltransferase
MGGRRQLEEEDKTKIKSVLSQLLAQREEIRFACLHGSFLGPHGFRDVDIAVWLDPGRVPRETAKDYEFTLSAWVERELSHPVDVKVLNYAPLSFQYAATDGEAVFLRDEEEWFAFREQTWREYLDYAPVAKEALLDLLSPGPP